MLRCVPFVLLPTLLAACASIPAADPPFYKQRVVAAGIPIRASSAVDPGAKTLLRLQGFGQPSRSRRF